MKSYSMTIQMKAIEQFILVGLYKEVKTFEFDGHTHNNKSNNLAFLFIF